MPSPALILPGVFLSTPSARRATLTDQTGGRVWWISIHALREEGDVKHTASSEVENIFLSTPSARRATFGGVMVIATIIISIHALREEGDVHDVIFALHTFYFYPRPPRGGRPAFTRAAASEILFLSTPSARRATPPFHLYNIAYCISIHALREEGDATGDYLTLKAEISIHALREEGDVVGFHQPFQAADFYPRPPRGGRPSHRQPLMAPSSYFYPRPPRGGRLASRICSSTATVFLSTPSARRATAVRN